MQICRRAKKYYAIDSDSRVIKFCNTAYNSPNTTFQKCNVENLPFRANFLDIIYLLWVINYIKNKNKAINEIYRVLKKNGYVILVDTSKHCDLDDIFNNVLPHSEVIPEINYELPFSKNFTLIRKEGPFKIPYLFPTSKKALELTTFIIEKYLGLKLGNKQKKIIKINLGKFIERTGLLYSMKYQ